MAAPDRVQDTPDGALKPAAGSPMARWGQRLIDHGFRILPIQPATKKPGLYRTERWVDYPQWTRHGARATTTHELAIWSRWPEAGIGIATGNAIAIDIDVTDAQAAAAIEALAKAMLGETTAVRIGKAPKRLLLYRAAEPFAGFKRQPIEVLGLGQQFVAFGVHPHTGEPYRWPADAPTDYPIDLLPTITAPQAQRFLDAAFALVPLDQRPNTLQGAAREGANEARANDITARSDVSQELRGTPEAIAQALEHIRNDDLDYDSWVRIGMAIKGALGEEGRAHFAAWSAQAPKNDAATTEQTWLSFKPQRIGAGTIYKLAFARGWSPPEDLALCGEPPESHPARTLLARLTAGLPQGSTLAPPSDRAALATPAHAPLRPASANEAVFTLPANDPLFAEPAAETVPPPEPLPPGWDCVGGVLGELMALMTKTAKRPQPVLALGASLCALGALMGRKYRTETNARSNLYIVGIAESGAGKNHSRVVIHEVMRHAGLGMLLGGNKIASGAGFLNALQRQPSILFQIDEFGMFLAAAADRRRSPRYLTEILDLMTELYTTAGSTYFGIEYASSNATLAHRPINQPCACVYGTTTPLHFWRALQATNVADGSLARFLILRSACDFPDPNPSFGLIEPPQRLLEALRTMAYGGLEQPTMAQLASAPEVDPQPRTVVASAQAKARFAALEAELLAQLRRSSGSGYTSILARIEENAQKLALIRAVSNDARTPRIEAADALWGIDLARHCAEQTIREVSERVSENETESMHKRALKLLREAGSAGMSRTEFCRKTQFMDLRQRSALLIALQDSEQLVMECRPGARRPTVWLRYAGEAAER